MFQKSMASFTEKQVQQKRGGLAEGNRSVIYPSVLEDPRGESDWLSGEVLRVGP